MNAQTLAKVWVATETARRLARHERRLAAERSAAWEAAERWHEAKPMHRPAATLAEVLGR